MSKLHKYKMSKYTKNYLNNNFDYLNDINFKIHYQSEFQNLKEEVLSKLCRDKGLKLSENNLHSLLLNNSDTLISNEYKYLMCDIEKILSFVSKFSTSYYFPFDCEFYYYNGFIFTYGTEHFTCYLFNVTNLNNKPNLRIYLDKRAEKLENKQSKKK